MAEQPNVSPAEEKMTSQPGDVDLEAANCSEIKEKTVTNASAGEPVYSVFSRRQIIFIAAMASISTFFSPLSANIYFPALNTIANDLQISDTLVNLTVTTYMIFQGLAPAFVGGLSDSLGRRPLYIFCFVTYIIANIALGIQNNYPALMVLRCLQSTGISGTVALSNAAIADVITSAERGTYIGWTSVGGALGPSLSPIIGGLLSQYLGYHAVFWFLAIFGGCFAVPLLLFFPETCRTVVGNGSIPPPKWNKSLLNHLDERRRAKAGHSVDFQERDRLAAQRSLKVPNPIMATLVMVAELETGLSLIFMGLQYAGLYAIFVGIPSQFALIYGFSNTLIGLVFLAAGVGGLLAAFTQGKLLDWNYARHAKKLGMPVSKSKQQDLSNFPIERARLEISVLVVFVASLLMIAYGWMLEYAVHVSVPFVLLFFLGYLAIASFNPLSILIVDLHPKSPGTATAAMNLVRCLLGAGATAVVLPMLDAMGKGWCYTFVGLLQIAIIPLQVVIIVFGPRWRRRQKVRDKQRRANEEGNKGVEQGPQKEGQQERQQGAPNEARRQKDDMKDAEIGEA